jgi:hypothetical protein
MDLRKFWMRMVVVMLLGNIAAAVLLVKVMQQRNAARSQTPATTQAGH